jgi:hypothetical protein
MKNVLNLFTVLCATFAQTAELSLVQAKIMDMYQGTIFELLRVVRRRLWSSGLWHHVVS